MARKAIAYALVSLMILLTSCDTAQPALKMETPATTQQPPAVSASASTVPVTAPITTLACPDASGPIQGTIVFVSDGNLMSMAQNGGQIQQIVKLPTIQWAQNPVWSPDTQSLAYTLNVQNPDEALSWLPLSLICGMDRTTGKGRILAQGQTYESLTEPAWTSDGKELYVSLARHQLDTNKQYLGTETEIARYDLGSNTATTVAKDSSGAALSHDGKHLAYVYNNPESFELQLMLAGADGRNPQAIRGPGSGFGTVLGASWTDDGTRLVFAASTSATAQQSSEQPAPTVLDYLLGVKVAQAHGAPMDLWIVDADGKNLKRVTDKNYDDPRATWSPDKQDIAIVTNGGGIILVNIANGTERQLTELGNFGGITWAVR